MEQLILHFCQLDQLHKETKLILQPFLFGNLKKYSVKLCLKKNFIKVVVSIFEEMSTCNSRT